MAVQAMPSHASQPLIHGRYPYLSYMINGVKAADQASPSSSVQI